MKRLEFASMLLAIYFVFISIVLYIYTRIYSLSVKQTYTFIISSGIITMILGLSIYLTTRPKPKPTDNLKDVETPKEKSKNDTIFIFCTILVFALVMAACILFLQYKFIPYQINRPRTEINMTLEQWENMNREAQKEFERRKRIRKILEYETLKEAKKDDEFLKNKYNKLPYNTRVDEEKGISEIPVLEKQQSIPREKEQNLQKTFIEALLNQQKHGDPQMAYRSHKDEKIKK